MFFLNRVLIYWPVEHVKPKINYLIFLCQVYSKHFHVFVKKINLQLKQASKMDIRDLIDIEYSSRSVKIDCMTSK